MQSILEQGCLQGGFPYEAHFSEPHFEINDFLIDISFTEIKTRLSCGCVCPHTHIHSENLTQRNNIRRKGAKNYNLISRRYYN